MCEVSISGVDVPLPEPLRPQQRDFMEACMNCFIEGKIGILESADGIGRTLALLCTSLGWLLHNATEKSVKTVLYVCSSEQNRQSVVNEFFKIKTSFASVRVDFLNESFTERKVSTPQIIFSEHHMFSRELLFTSNKCPPKIDLPNALVIVDDSHLIEESCRNAASASLSLCKLDQIIQELLKEKTQDSKTLQLISKLENLKNIFRGIIPLLANASDPCYRSQEIDKLFCRIKLDEPDLLLLKQHPNTHEVEQFISLINIFCYNNMVEKSNGVDDQELMETKNDLESFTMYVTETASGAAHVAQCKSGKCKTLNFLCLDPSVVIRRMIDRKPHSVIFSSASITPFDSLKSELGIIEAREFIGKPIIEDHQIFARIVTCGAGGYFLNSSYSQRFDKDYLTSVGQTIQEVSKVTPHGQGMIVYFTSYELLNLCKYHWETFKVKDKTIWQNISEHKDTFAVSSDDVSFQDFHERLESPLVRKKGCCVLAVLRGKVSKDTSVKKEHKRVIVMVGVPFLPTNEPAIKLKERYNNEKYAAKQSSLSGPKFLSWEAYKAVKAVTESQISLNCDYGVLLLLDKRFETHKLSTWLRKTIKSEKRFTEMMQELNDFFSSIKMRTEWTMATSENHTRSSIQFGKVHSWEMEKLRLDYISLKKKNAALEYNIRNQTESIASLDNEREYLETKLVELAVKEQNLKTQGKPQSFDNQGAGDERCSVTKKEMPAEVPVSPAKFVVSPRKRPYPEDPEDPE